ncbi:hypothetical protein LTLLF_132240 [Microtus ochrogaster]|uniref:DUF5580 domain-containing protein n=1 Tax=Microtus ochrogaster TaxID=79684 RepID=A0A8J6GJZ1_MICOH|nr:hypothetical protein LTLLF_132240 [Microtus ochrogaster]
MKKSVIAQPFLSTREMLAPSSTGLLLCLHASQHLSDQISLTFKLISQIVLKTPEENLWPENPTTMISAPQEPVNSFKKRPVSQPDLSPAMMKEAEQPELWIDRFRKLEKALYLCDLSNTGVLEKERVRRLIHNYNLIYNLSLSPQKIDLALRRFRSGENVMLEPALRYLKEL